MIKVYIHYLRLKDFMDYQPIFVRTSFSSIDDIEVYIKIKSVYMFKQSDGMVIRRKKFLEKLMFWRKSLR